MVAAALAEPPHVRRLPPRVWIRGQNPPSGYPRDDVLVGGAGVERATSARRRLGLPERGMVILYAPTFRSPGSRHQSFDHRALVTALGPDATVLLRGHSSTMRRGDDVVGDGVVDVTTYPEITDLYLVADVFITDYSSVMFDFTITGKPILFFVPDLPEYRDTMRGTYFDLGAVSPGPMLETTGRLSRRCGPWTTSRRDSLIGMRPGRRGSIRGMTGGPPNASSMRSSPRPTASTETRSAAAEPTA